MAAEGTLDAEHFLWITLLLGVQGRKHSLQKSTSSESIDYTNIKNLGPTDFQQL